MYVPAVGPLDRHPVKVTFCCLSLSDCELLDRELLPCELPDCVLDPVDEPVDEPVEPVLP